MKQSRLLMGMPMTIEIVDPEASPADLAAAWEWFRHVDDRFSTYKPTSEISMLNTGRLTVAEASQEMRSVLDQAATTKIETDGFFDIHRDGRIDPSGLVKGWAIERAAELLRQRGRRNFFVDAGGDVAAVGLNAAGQPWRVGIRHPFRHDQIAKVLQVSNQGVATSGTYLRGQHIYNPHYPSSAIEDIVSLTVVAANVYDADRFATAVFAMGRAGIEWLEARPGLEGYMIDAQSRAILTSGFDRYVISHALAR